MENIIDVRKYLHANPELSGKEYNTTDFIFSYLQQQTAVSEIYKLTTGVIAVYDSGCIGDTTLIRADIDALPIQEINSFEHKSTIKNVSHKCGHDGHTAILLEIAKKISENTVQKGKVILLFQPAEETGEGAKKVLKHSFFSNLKIATVLALHNIPGYKAHSILIKKGVFTANVTTLIIKIKGKTAHAAEPEHGKNPSIVIASILSESQKMVINHPEKPNFFLVTPIYTTIGNKAYGVSAGYGEVHFTIRGWDKDLLTSNCEKLEQFVKNICKNDGFEYEITYTQSFLANINDESTVSCIQEAAIKNELEIIQLEQPFKWGEDFGLFTEKYKGAMFGIGSGVDCPALHNPDYDFPDEIIQTGVSMFFSIIEKAHYH